MDLHTFRQSLAQAEPPPGLGVAARGLWWDAKGDWDKAHGCAQEQDDAAGAWASLAQEWEAIARALLEGE